MDQHLPQLTWAEVQRWLDTSRLDKAAAALGALQKEVEQAAARGTRMRVYLDTLYSQLVGCYVGASEEEADLLYHRAGQ